MTEQEALTLRSGQTIYSTISRGCDKRPHRVRVSSVRYKIPNLVTITAKFGIHKWVRIHETHFHEWSLTENEAMKSPHKI
jgi:hypothetical protein